MRLRMRRSRLSEYIFIALWTIYSACFYLFSASDLSFEYNVSGLLRYVEYVVIAVQLFTLVFVCRYSKKTLLQYLAALVFVFLLELSASDRTLLIYILFVMLAREINVDRLIRYDIKLKAVLLVVIIGMCLLGITENYTMTSNGSYKQAVGFSHPNAFTCFVMTMLVEWLCIRYGKMKWYDWIAILGILVVTMEIGGGRTSVYTFALIYLLYFIANFRQTIFYARISTWLFRLAAPLMCIVSLVAIYLCDVGNKLGSVLNNVMTDRLALAASAISQYGIKLLGQDVDYVGVRRARINGTNYLVVDNAYARCALSWGLLFMIILVVLYSLLFAKLLERKRLDLVLLSLFFVILGFGETYMLNVLYNISLLCLLQTPKMQTTEKSVSKIRSGWSRSKLMRQKNNG